MLEYIFCSEKVIHLKQEYLKQVYYLTNIINSVLKINTNIKIYNSEKNLI